MKLRGDPLRDEFGLDCGEFGLDRRGRATRSSRARKLPMADPGNETRTTIDTAN
jgi:hypothetical protein